MLMSFHDLQKKFASVELASDGTEIVKLPNSAKLRTILRMNNIPYGYDTRNRPFTTLDAVNHALGIPTGAVVVKADKDVLEV
jgi:hypothetical protein